VYLGLNPKYSEREFLYVLRDGQPRVIFVFQGEENTDYVSRFARAARQCSHIQSVIVDRPFQQKSWRELDDFLTSPTVADSGHLSVGDPNQPAAIVYTSGSTGQPKGALLSQTGMVRTALLSWEHWYGGLTRPQTIAQHPINHVGWLVCECVSTLVAGGTTHFRERFDAAATWRLIEAKQIDLWIAFPAMVMLAMAEPEFETTDLSSLRRLALGSSPSVTMLERFAQRSTATCCVSYGLTEASGGALTVTGADDSFETIATTMGTALPGVELRLAAQTDGPPNTGEILVRDPSVFLGYLNRPEGSADVIDSDGWLHTGDVATRRADGRLKLVGRTQEMFKSGGYNVYPAEVESVLETYPEVRTCAVVGVPHATWGEVGIAFVVVTDTSAVNAGDLRTYAREHLANYKIPKHWEFVGALPHLGNGKVDKVELRSRAHGMGGIS